MVSINMHEVANKYIDRYENEIDSIADQLVSDDKNVRTDAIKNILRLSCQVGIEFDLEVKRISQGQ